MLFSLGVFRNESGKFIVSDPCYKLGAWCQGELNDVLTGQWFSYVEKVDTGDCGIRCSSLHAYHESIKDLAEPNWETCNFHVGVDSGQAGIFDVSVYQNDESVIGDTEFMTDEKWYSSCCDRTLTKLGAGVINGGVVSSTGYGEGVYYACISKNNDGMINAVKIVFITEDEL